MMLLHYYLYRVWSRLYPFLFFSDWYNYKETTSKEPQEYGDFRSDRKWTRSKDSHFECLLTGRFTCMKRINPKTLVLRKGPQLLPGIHLEFSEPKRTYRTGIGRSTMVEPMFVVFYRFGFFWKGKDVGLLLVHERRRDRDSECVCP